MKVAPVITDADTSDINTFLIIHFVWLFPVNYLGCLQPPPLWNDVDVNSLNRKNKASKFQRWQVREEKQIIGVE